MVATTFSTDTPNLVTDFVRSHGVSYNWVWWAFLLTGMATVFFYAQLWRRSRVLTDLEFYELRYSGRPAALVRGFRAVYLGFFFNIMIMSTVTLAAVKIANVMLGWGRLETILIAGTACVLFASISGLWGVLATDLVQFALAMIGVIAAAYVSLDQPAVGGLSGMLSKIDPKTLSLLPDFHDTSLTLTVLVIPLTDSVVVRVVSGFGARRRQLCRATHPGFEERAARTRCNALVQRRALCAATVAVDHRGALLDARLPDARRHSPRSAQCRSRADRQRPRVSRRC